MKLTFTIALSFLGAAYAQDILLQCAVQGDGDYNIVKTAEYTSPSCSAAGGSLGKTPGGGRAGGISCCTTPASGKDTFYSTCKTFGDGVGILDVPLNRIDFYIFARLMGQNLLLGHTGAKW